MTRRRIAIAGLLAVGAALIGLIAGAQAARLRTGPLVVVADGGFKPQVLPRRSYAPISFWGHAEIRTVTGAPPPALQQVTLKFDRDGKLTTAGLPVCQPESIADASPQEARQRCEGAIVGTGHAAALVALPGSNPVTVESPLTIFNGPRQEGNPTFIAHARTTYPATQTYVVVGPIERLGGPYSYRTTFEIPPIAEGHGVLTHVDVRIGRRYRAGGVDRSYVSARCSDNVLKTHGLFRFANGLILSGDVFRACHAVE